MAATFGVEAMSDFSAARAAGINVGDLPHAFDIGNGFDNSLRSGGNKRQFYWTGANCWEKDFRDVSLGGIDTSYGDAVDAALIVTHGTNDQGRPVLLFGSKHDDWFGRAQNWVLGNWNLEWLFAYSCHTVDRNNVLGLWNIFNGLHLYCGAWEVMWDCWTTDECGEDLANDLLAGKCVSDAWIDGVSDWLVDNHPIAVAAENAAFYNNGNPIWSKSTLYTDHFWGHGNTCADIPASGKVCLSYTFAEG